MTFLQFAVDELVGEVNLVCVLLGVAVIYTVHTGPIKGGQTHRARFAGTINLASPEGKSLLLAASLTNCVYFGMGGRVIGKSNRIGSGSNHLTVPDDNSTERASALVDIVFRNLRGHFHKSDIFRCNRKSGCFHELTLKQD